ncbi:hypothetical protein ACUNV4_25065 [Granulosicoccus sp. 3-233]|uniref:hypothetical protein n=1 Tax=Granulosicoccus sp. 3-233 TaxID=3417969 RepID=UPI003D32AA33
MQFKASTLTLSTLASLVLLTACDSSTGGAAGDDLDDNLEAIELLAPFTGIYDLQDDWSTLDGMDTDEAFLTIDTPGSEGTSEALFHDFDDLDNCFPSRPTEGIVRKDDFSDRIFLDDIFQFADAELFLSGTTLTIEFNDDFDLDADGSTQDRISVTAEQLGVARLSDLGADC